MDLVTINVYGEEKLAKTLDEIDSLVVSLRRKLAELNEGRLQLEMILNHPSDGMVSGVENVKK